MTRGGRVPYRRRHPVVELAAADASRGGSPAWTVVGWVLLVVVVAVMFTAVTCGRALREAVEEEAVEQVAPKIVDGTAAFLQALSTVK